MRAALVLCLFLAACATPAPHVPIRTVEVHVPTPVTCVPDLPPPLPYPDTPEALTSAPDVFEAAKLYVAGRLMRIQREKELEAALKACR